MSNVRKVLKEVDEVASLNVSARSRIEVELQPALTGSNRSDQSEKNEPSVHFERRDVDERTERNLAKVEDLEEV